MTSESAAGSAPVNAAVSELNKLRAILAPTPSSEINPPDLEAELKGIQPVESRILRGILFGLPWLLLLACLVRASLFDVRPGVVMYLSSLVAVAAALFGFQVLMRQLKDVPRSLWERNLIAASTRDGRVGSDTSLVADYTTFVRDFGAMLNDRRQFALGVALGLAGAVWVVYEASQGVSFGVVRTVWELALAFGLGAFIGLLAWRMAITGFLVSKLGRLFDLRLQVGHPDRCGGLSSLGNLCFWNALIISVAGIHLGGWLIIAPSLSPPYQALAAEYHDLYLGLLIIPVVFAAVSFFLPLWTVHEEMLTERDRLRRQLNQISRRMDQLSRQMLEQADELDPAALEVMAKQIKSMRDTYIENQHLPVWPFDTRILAKFATTQTVPLLGLTGLGAPLVKAISSLLSFLEQPT